MSLKQKILIYITVIILLTGTVIYAVILPTIQDIKEINQAVIAERIDLEKKYLRGQLLKQTVENFEKIKPQEDKLSKIYIAQNAELEFITKLEGIANANNVSQEIQLSTPTIDAGETYEPLALAITSNGSFVNLLQYLKDIELMESYFNISKLAINTEGRNQQAGKPITIEMVGQVFKLLKADSSNTQ